jgi:excinuclease ABC subunit B
MPPPRKSRPAPRAKASRPDVNPLDDHLAALLNPALAEPRLSASAAGPLARRERYEEGWRKRI